MQSIRKWLVLLAVATLSQAAVADAPGQLFVVHFSTGPAWDTTRPPGEQTGFREHSANLERMRDAGTILFGARYDDYGMRVVHAASREAATALFADDPGVTSEIFVYRVAPLSVFYPWKEPAAAED